MLEYLTTHGYSLLPLREKSKIPMENNWPCAKSLTPLEAEAHRNAGHNLGLRCGSKSKISNNDGLIVLDFDIRTDDSKEKRKALSELHSLIGALKDHPRVSSGSQNGSCHIYLSCPVSSMPKSQILKKTKDWEIQLCAEGRQVVIPPSTHPGSGRKYSWVCDLEKGDIKSITDLPLWGFIKKEPTHDYLSGAIEIKESPVKDLGEIRISGDMKALIENGDTEAEYDSRSEAIYAAINALVGAGASDVTIIGALSDGAHALSEAVLERGRGSIERCASWLKPQINKARAQQEKEAQSDFELIDETEDVTGKDLEDEKALAPIALEFISSSRVPPTEWVIPGRLVKKFVTVTAAPGGYGKTTLTMQEALSIATGKSLGIGEVRETGPVWVFNNEDPRDEILRRILAIAKHWSLDLKELNRQGNIFINSGRKRNERLVVAAEKGRGSRVTLVKKIKVIEESILRHGIKLLIVDPFGRSHCLNENDNSDMDMVADIFSELADKTNCCVNLVHHTRKMGKGVVVAGNPDSIRGASAVVNAARIANTLDGMSKEEADAFGIDPEKKGWYCRFDNAKNNMSPPSDKARWFKRVSVDLDNGSAKAPSEARGVLVPWEPPQTTADGLPKDTIDAVLRAIKLAWDCGDPYCRAANSSRPITNIARDIIGASITEVQVRSVVAMLEQTERVCTERLARNSKKSGYNIRL
jgi:hypothetical protein